MRKTILSLSFILAASVGFTHAQDVFKKHGFKKKPLTFCNGQYNEFFNNPEVVQIGTTLFNTRTNKVVKLLDENTPKTTYKAEFSSMCIDPHAEKYYSVSPYVYCMNNPVKFFDPDGKEVYLFATRLPTTDGTEKSGVPFATHTFIVVRGSDNVNHYYAYGGENGMNGKLMKAEYQQDIQVYSDYAEGMTNPNLKAAIVMPIPEGMTSEQFDQKVISTAESFGNNPNVTYVLTGGGETGGNCNTSTSTILSKSGVDEKTLSDTKSNIPGLVWGFGDIKPWTATEQKAAVQKENKVLEEANKYIK